MEYLLGLLGALAAGFFYYRTKAKSAGALLENVETKKQINEISSETAALAGRIDVEQERREAIQRDTKEKTEGVETNEELVRFIDAFSKRPKP